MMTATEFLEKVARALRREVVERLRRTGSY
jgi:hypothetical protein